MEGSAHDPSLGIHAGVSQGAARRGGPRRRPPGAGAIQVARASRHARGGNQAMTDDLNMTPQGEAYVRWFHEANVWKNMQWHGIRTLKLPSDIWNYQEIIFEHRIEHVIETGTRHGGSALFFAETLAARNARGPVVSIDIDDASRQLTSHDGIHFLVGDSAASDVVARALALLLRELHAWVPALSKGDYLVVEDTIVNGHPVRPGHGPGPLEAITEYIAEAPGLLLHDAGREAKFGASFAVRGHYLRV